jgi:hypothetical protein
VCCPDSGPDFPHQLEGALANQDIRYVVYSLNELFGSAVPTRTAVRQAAFGKCLNDLKGHEDEAVASLSATILAKWAEARYRPADAAPTPEAAPLSDADFDLLKKQLKALSRRMMAGDESCEAECTRAGELFTAACAARATPQTPSMQASLLVTANDPSGACGGEGQVEHHHEDDQYFEAALVDNTTLTEAGGCGVGVGDDGDDLIFEVSWQTVSTARGEVVSLTDRTESASDIGEFFTESEDGICLSRHKV